VTEAPTAVYLDEDVLSFRSGLEALQYVVYTTTAHGRRGASDAVQLRTAVELRAILITNNRHDFVLTRSVWRTLGAHHFSIISFRGPTFRANEAEQVRRIDKLIRRVGPQALENLMWVWEAAWRR
jgi:hypothetical protein